jgi:hypothetical protein
LKERVPLEWPAQQPRTPAGQRIKSQFGERTFYQSCRYVEDELRRLHAIFDDHRYPMYLSTARKLNNDGSLNKVYAGKLEDPAAAMHFVLPPEGDERYLARDDPKYKAGVMPVVLAADRFVKLQDNVYAIGLHIDAMRGQQRWGVGNIRMQFAGYRALPAPTWPTILGVQIDATADQIDKAFRAKAKQLHPDKPGGDADAFARLTEALKQAEAALKMRD